MKKFIAFFVMIYNWFISLFKTKEKIKPEKISTPEIKWTNRQEIPPHNNRKITRGRFVQYINVGEGRTRSIYHGANCNEKLNKKKWWQFWK
jgi:hypothetical protein